MGFDEASISAVIVPFSNTRFLGGSYVKKVTTIGPFSPWLPRCVCPAVTPCMYVAIISYVIESDATCPKILASPVTSV
jgi:hypothetical protein